VRWGRRGREERGEGRQGRHREEVGGGRNFGRQDGVYQRVEEL